MMNPRELSRSLPILLLVGALLAFVGCSLDAPDDPSALVNPPGVEDAGARYVAVGNSLTAGFMDGGLMMAGQTTSFPKLIAGQLGLGSTQFTQPWIASPGIGGLSGADVTGVLYFDGASIAVLGTTPLASVQSQLLLAVTQPTQYHNLGVPGATLHDGMNAYSAATSAGALVGSPNPFFDFINRASFFGNQAVASGYPGPSGLVPVTYQSASQFAQAVAKGGALTTLWMGYNDVLGPARSGEPPAGFGNPGTPGAAAFQADYTAMLSMLSGGLARRNYGLKPTVIVANLPAVTSAPYFIPKTTFDAYVTSTPVGGPWPGGFEETGVQYVLFTALTWIATNSPATPIPDEYTLDAGETNDVTTATAVFNTIIGQVAAAINAAGVANVGVVDAYALFTGLTAPEKTHFLFIYGQLRGGGASVQDAIDQAAAATLFSLDGIHPNSHGYGVVANAFIDKINEVDGTSLAHVDPASLPWDPTYGQVPTKSGTRLGLDPEAAAAMDAIFR